VQKASQPSQRGLLAIHKYYGCLRKIHNVPRDRNPAGNEAFRAALEEARWLSSFGFEEIDML